MPTVLYEKKGRIAYLTLNRPKRFNAIDSEMPAAIEKAVHKANDDADVHVIILQGAGAAFCSGYDLKEYAEKPRPVVGSQNMPWDPTIDYKMMKRNTEQFMSLWRSYKPTICKIHGYVTGDLVSGKEAYEMGLVYKSCPADELESAVNQLANRMAGIPQNQLMMQKMVINQAYNQMGMETTQMIATLFDGITRHSPEGVAFKERCEKVGFKKAVKERDSGVEL